MPFSFFGLIKPNIKKLKANNDVEGLVEALKYRRDYTIRQEAAEALKGIDKSWGKIPVLYNALCDPDKEVRKNVAKAISVIGADEEGIPYLIESLSNEDWEIRRYVCSSLAALGVKAVPALAQAIKHESVIVRENAVHCLGMMKSNAAQALPILLDALSDFEFEEKKWIVVEAIGNFGSMAKDAVPQLLDVWDKEPGIRYMVETLGKIGSIKAIDPLLKQLFAVPKRNYEAENFKKVLLALVSDSSLLKEVVEWAVRASTYEKKGERHGGGWYEAGYITLEDSDEAIKCLCNVNAPVVNNLLHLIAQKKDISVTMDTGCSGPWQEKVSFENQREQAVNELKKRGNPTYRPEFYYKISEVETKEFVRQVETAQQKERERRYQFLLSFLKKPNKGVRENDDRATYSKELINNYKTMEVFRLLASDLVREYDTHLGLGLYESVKWLIAIGQEFGGTEVRSTLSNVLRHLTRSLANIKTIRPDGLHSFETAFVELGKELPDQEVVSALAAIKGPWPYSYQTVLKRIEKKS